MLLTNLLKRMLLQSRKGFPRKFLVDERMHKLIIFIPVSISKGT
jgi:hypothetical protein